MTLAAFSHVAGGGSSPGVLGVVLAIGLSLPLSVALAGRGPSLVRLSIVVAVSQAAFHLLFSLGGGGAARVDVSGGGHHAHETMVLAADTSMSSGTMPAMHHGGAMWIAHAAAALVTVVGLWRGERAVCAAVGLADQVLLTVITVSGIAATTAPQIVRHLVPRVARIVPHALRAAVPAQPLRGPPLPA
ncbi:hypothetical protein IFT90_12105 [Frigoribacterium sp. CFBP 8766]|nr:hypothetical protein [Frigoribacterium sp. CFBP 8766]